MNNIQRQRLAKKLAAKRESNPNFSELNPATVAELEALARTKLADIRQDLELTLGPRVTEVAVYDDMTILDLVDSIIDRTETLIGVVKEIASLAPLRKELVRALVGDSLKRCGGPDSEPPINHVFKLSLTFPDHMLCECGQHRTKHQLLYPLGDGIGPGYE